MNNKIFIQIASYRDPELLPTIEDCISNADKPENLVFSIAWQHAKEDTWDNLDKYKNDARFKILDINYKDSKGCCWARNALQHQYNEEDYTLQLDSHHRFVKGWDSKIIELYGQLLRKGFKKPLLTAYLPPYDIDNDPGGRTMTPYQMNFDRFIPEGPVFFLPAAIADCDKLTEPIPARFYSGHFTFTTGLFVKEVPHDPNYLFHGEEISVGVRAYTHGYDLFHPHILIAWHEYSRSKRVKYWSDKPNWGIQNEESFLRNRKLFQMDGLTRDYSFGRYDFGTERTLEDYEKYAGISFSKRSVQRYTLENNLAPNPVLPQEEYEKSFLNIFKHCINVYKPELTETDYDFMAVIFEDEEGVISRTDAYPDEIKHVLQTPGDFVNIWRTIHLESTRRPKYWIVWPYSKSKGWCKKIVGKL